MLFLALAVFGADRATKLAVERSIPLHHSIDVVGQTVRLTHLRNTGVVFGMMGHSRLSGWPLAFLSAAILVGLLVYFWRLPLTRRLMLFGLALVIGGAAGNQWDRFVRRYVTDFVDVDLAVVGISRHWPAFNVADAAICVGVALMAIELWRGEGEAEPAAR